MRAPLSAWLFLLPMLVGVVVFGLIPAGRTVMLSLGPGEDRLVFYRLAVLDPLVWLAAVNTLGFAILFATLQTVFATVVALLIVSANVWAGRVLAAVLFAAHVLGATFAGVLFSAWFVDRRGGLNGLLQTVGLTSEPIDFLASPTLAMPILLAVALFGGTGFAVLWVLAALRRADPHIADAALLDGCGPLRRIRHATLPQIRPTLAMLVVAGLFFGMTLFELPYVLFDGPGPGYRVLTGAMLVFSAGLVRGDVGYASAIAVLLAIATTLVVALTCRLLRVGREEVGLE
ncbi:MAG: sugar ABC transporter permease [Planctomycetota bacterium]